jgi:hypothetical protein
MHTSDTLQSTGNKTSSEISALHHQLAETEGNLEASKIEAENNEKLGEAWKARAEEWEARCKGVESEGQLLKMRVAELDARLVGFKWFMACDRLSRNIYFQQDESETARTQLFSHIQDLEATLAEHRRGRTQHSEPRRLRVKGRHAPVGHHPPPPSVVRHAKKGVVPPTPALPLLPSDFDLPAPSDMATGQTTPTGLRTPTELEPPPLPTTSPAFQSAIAMAKQQQQQYGRRSWSPPRMPAIEMVSGPGPQVSWGTKGAGEIHKAGPIRVARD